MPNKEKLPMSVAEVLEIVPSENSWVNNGFSAVVRQITAGNGSKKNWKCTLQDTTGSATILMTVWTAPRFNEGDVIDVLGQGIKRKEYNGTPEVGIGQKTEIHVVGRHVEKLPDRKPDRQPGGAASDLPPQQHPEQLEAIRGDKVGMALKEAAAAVLEAAKAHSPAGTDLLTYLTSPAYSKDLYTVASDIIRISRVLEKGLLAPNPKHRAAGAVPTREEDAKMQPERREEAPPPDRGGRADPVSKVKPEAGPGGTVKFDPDEDVPF